MVRIDAENARSPLRLLLCGAGRVVEKYYGPALYKNRRFKVAGVVDSSPARRDWAAQAFKAPTSATVSALLDQGGFDAALIATPPSAQASLAVQVLARGVPVLIEKPGARSLTEATEVVKVAANLPVRLALSRRYWERYCRMRDQLHGTISHWSVQIETNPVDWGHLELEQAAGPAGLIDDLLPHAFDIATSVLGVSLNTPDKVGWEDGLLSVHVAGESPGEIRIKHGTRWFEVVTAGTSSGVFQVRSDKRRSLKGAAGAILSRLSSRPSEPVDAISMLLESFAFDLEKGRTSDELLRYAAFSEQVKGLATKDS